MGGRMLETGVATVFEKISKKSEEDIRALPTTIMKCMPNQINGNSSH